MISVKNLTKVYDKVAVVDNISFQVKQGDIFAFLGPNGAGKSTTIKMLTTVLRPTKGDIFLNQKDIFKHSKKARESFGIVFQDPSLDDELTAYENMRLHAVLYKVPKDQIEKRIKKLLTIVDLYQRKNNFVSTFSGGMKRRLEIARGFLHIPKILFLDEPTVGLDPQTRKHIWNYIKKINKSEKTTIFFTTHYMDEVEKNAKTIAIIDKGKIITTGNLKKIITKTKTKNLEDAFIKLTGKDIRAQEVNGLDKMRMRRKLRRR